MICDENNLRKVSKALQGIDIHHQDYKEVLKKAKKGDFIYFDPPYYPLAKGSVFTSYTKENFLEKEQKKLADIFEQLDRRGCLLMLSNSNTKFIRNLYKKWHITKVNAKRFINCIAEKRGDVSEVVVRNYK